MNKPAFNNVIVLNKNELLRTNVEPWEENKYTDTFPLLTASYFISSRLEKHTEVM